MSTSYQKEAPRLCRGGSYPFLLKTGLLYQGTEKFTQIDLHPDAVSNMQMGLVFEELIRKFSEISNETAGEHFTPREVIHVLPAVQYGRPGWRR